MKDALAHAVVEAVALDDRMVGPRFPVYVIAEIGINHNGSLDIAKKLIDAAVAANCDAVKFQKREPTLCIPPSQRNVTRNTPWGFMSYLEYRKRIEFGHAEYEEIDRYCAAKGISWFASCWDIPSVDFMAAFNTPCYKICSASLTDDPLLEHTNRQHTPMILSTGMSTMEQIRHAVSLLDQDRLLVAHCTSSYVCQPEEINLRMISTLMDEFDTPIGYSGHELGTITTCAAVAMGACFVERHITLDRSMWGSDQAGSLEPWDLQRLVHDIREIEKSMGDGRKRVYASERSALERLRRNR